MAPEQAAARRGSAWLIAATVAVCAVGFVALWLVRTQRGAPAGTATDLPSAPSDIEGRVTTVPKWVTPAAGPGTGGTRDPDAPVSSEDAAAVGPGGGLLGVVLVEAERSADKASVTITERTVLLIQRGGETAPGTLDDLKQGSRVRIWYAGPVAESYPVQATAGTILVLGADRQSWTAK